jgi:hypothetical protein
MFNCVYDIQKSIFHQVSKTLNNLFFNSVLPKEKSEDSKSLITSKSEDWSKGKLIVIISNCLTKEVLIVPDAIPLPLPAPLPYVSCCWRRWLWQGGYAGWDLEEIGTWCSGSLIKTGGWWALWVRVVPDACWAFTISSQASHSSIGSLVSRAEKNIFGYW